MNISSFTKILIITHILRDKKVEYSIRQLTTIYRLTDLLLESGEKIDYVVYPDGFESEYVNTIIELLISKGFLHLENGVVKIVDPATRYVESILMNPDSKFERIYFRAVAKLLTLDYITLFNILAKHSVESKELELLVDDEKVREVLMEVKGFIRQQKRLVGLEKKRVD